MGTDVLAYGYEGPLVHNLSIYKGLQWVVLNARQCTGGPDTHCTHPYCWIDLSNKLREGFNSLIGYSDTALTVKIGNT